MPCLAPVPRQTLPPAEIPVAMRWSHSERTTAWSSKTVETFRHDIDYMQECVEWHPADRVMRKFGYVQPPPGIPRDIPVDHHCIVLRGVQLHDWTVLRGPWIVEWANRRHSRLRDLHPLPTWDFLPTLEYRDWYMRSYGHLLRLTGHRSTVMVAITLSSPSTTTTLSSPPHSHHSQQSQHSHHSQHHDPILTIPSGHDWFDFSSDGPGDQLQQDWIDAGLGGWSDFSSIPSPSVPADPRRASVDMGHALRGRTSDHASESASCDSGFSQRQRGYAVVDTFIPGPSAPAEAGGSAAPTEAGGSAAPTDAGGSVRGHSYDLRTERNPPDRYTPSRLGTGIMRKGLHWFVGKK
ncbi:hypothetical protein Ahy_A04g021269 [Arachis hypogaea]|uniref:Aminotransferase-like plant mobile domain-containing protein n=1 Tax=Arachis hypogaea TaxID=3818 RepID=A0A445DKA8_ARAHY|nr:hypothetical protein Ahy_A04g021269 [Arachis hypogaea]